MTIDPALPDTSFSSVAKVGAMGAQEDEVLLSMNTVFRIGEIKQLGDNPRLFRVELSMTSEKDNDLRQLIDRIRGETFPKARGWYRLGSVSWKMGEAAKAQQVFEVLLQQTTEERARRSIYNQLEMMADNLGLYEEAIGYYEKAIRIKENQSPCNHHGLAASYNNIGNVYSRMADYPKALSSHEKKLEISQQSLPPTHFDLVMSYINMGLVHENMKNYSKAHSCYVRAMDIAQRSLPPDHPHRQIYRNKLSQIKKKL